MRAKDVERFWEKHLSELANETIVVGRVLYHRPIGLVSRGLLFDATSSGRFSVIPVLFRQLLYVRMEHIALDGGMRLRSGSGQVARLLERSLSDETAHELAQDVLTTGMRQLREWADWSVVESELVNEARCADSPHPFEQLAYTRILLGRFDEAEDPLRTALTICELTKMPKKWHAFHSNQIARLVEIRSLLSEPERCIAKLHEWAAHTKERVGLAGYE